MPTTRDALDALFHPRAVAVIGASDDGTKHGYIVLNNIRDTGFRGGIFGISRRLKEVDGIVCFPDLASVPEQVDTAFLAIPAAFTRQTGEAHWHVLMRARAIENTCYVLAAAQGGKHENGRETFGHSLVVDPWGRVIAEGGTEPGVVMAEIDLADITTARARIPSLQHGRRFEVITPAAEPAHLHAVGKTS